MKTLFPGYYRPTKKDFERLWDESLFAFDANILLNLHRCSEKTSAEMINIFKRYNERVWLPYQAAMEYHKNLYSVFEDHITLYGTIDSALDTMLENLGKKISPFRRKDPFIDVDALFQKIKNSTESVRTEIADKLAHQFSATIDNKLKEVISEAFEGKVGPPYDDKRRSEIYLLGKERYQVNTPPGFLDAKKEVEAERYGDLVIWFQLMDKSRAEKKSLIFVSDDTKEDWWQKVKGRTIGPRPELIHEMKDCSGRDFYMYNSDQFMEYALKNLKQKPKPDAVKEMKEVREQTKEAWYPFSSLSEAIAAQEVWKQGLMHDWLAESINWQEALAESIKWKEDLAESINWKEALAESIKWKEDLVKSTQWIEELTKPLNSYLLKMQEERQKILKSVLLPPLPKKRSEEPPESSGEGSP